jgi:hypothetical protein
MSGCHLESPDEGVRFAATARTLDRESLIATSLRSGCDDHAWEAFLLSFQACFDVPLEIINHHHHSVGRCLMNHVASAGNAIELTVRNFSMEPRRLLIDVDDPVPSPAIMSTGHL